jgi:hypothetical protein
MHRTSPDGIMVALMKSPPTEEGSPRYALVEINKEVSNARGDTHL